jgi:UDP-3-O-[3-hydroxymyristoyl] glucosamine N-acyltransferase
LQITYSLDNTENMKLPEPISVSEIAEKIGAEIIGDPNKMVLGLNEIHKVESGDLTFADKEKYYTASLSSAATFVILSHRHPCPEGKTLLICKDPFRAYNSLVKEQRPFVPLTAQISDTAEIHPTVIIEPNVVVGHHVKIGAHSIIQANTTIVGHTIIGQHVNIHPNSVIGSDAFYYRRYETHHEKWHSGGRVIIEDHVEIGACCSINIGVSGDTVIGEGTKLDSQIHIGHGAVVGKHCLFAAQVGVGGKAIIGDHVCLYGQVGVAQSIKIGDGAVVFGQAGMTKNSQGDKAYFGTPAQEVADAYRQLALIRKLPEIMKALKKLEKMQDNNNKPQ